MEKVSILGVMVGYISVNGPIINCMGKVNLPGPMEENTLVNSYMILKAGLAFTNGLMEKYMRVCGLTDNNTAKEYLQTLKEKAGKAYGKTGNEFSG